jgi:Na+-translocating ferredoxin:NAD+ oxidoreductase RNF subunit RnfB
MTSQNQTSAANKISTYLMLIVLVVLGLSIVALFASVYAYLIVDNMIAAAFLAIIGVFALAISATVMYQTQKRSSALKIEVPKVMTTIECKKCGFKNTREYQRGDYVFKQLDACQKCPDTKQLITAIYKEVKEKEKTYAV